MRVLRVQRGTMWATIKKRVIAWKDLAGIVLSEISQRKTNIVWLQLCVESKKQNQWTNVIRQKQSHRCWEQIGGCQRGNGWSMNETGKERLRGMNFQL